MTILEWILISLGAIIMLPTLAFLCVRQGTFGFFRGREVWRKRNEFISSVQNENGNETES